MEGWLSIALGTALLVAYTSGVPISDCCSLISGSCRTSCEQISLVSIALDSREKERRLKNLNQNCSRNLTVFWHCVNGSLQAIEESEGWVGRPCCKLPQSRSCRLACLKAKSKQDLYQDCRIGYEINFFNCVYHQEDAERCCSNSQTPECQLACREIFYTQRSPNRKLRNAVVHSCAHHSPKVLSCVKDHIKTAAAVTPSRRQNEYSTPNSADLECCDRSLDDNCRNVCKNALRMKASESEIVEVIQSACGLPLLSDKLWQCFLHNAKPAPPAVSRTNRIGMDSAKLQCCLKAVNAVCRKLCFQAFDNDWTNSWEVFEKRCAANLAETEMFLCLVEVDEPCKLGCKGLTYCTNFNDRSTELFQSCTGTADHVARKEMEKWQLHSSIDIPTMLIHVQDINTCYPEVWKAIACTLQVKPCQQKSHGVVICKSDCTDILRKCLDYNNLPPGITPESVCDKLSPQDDEENCVSFSTFLERSPDARYSYQVTQPCHSNNCNATDLCMVNRDCLPGQNCQPYKCQPGCKMGDSSPVVVVYGAYVRIPVNSAVSPCYKICRCSERLVIEDCHPMPCSQPRHCWKGSRRIEHGKVFDADCNQCICYNGTISCTRFICTDDLERNSVTFTGLPCNCAPHYVPYCGADGKTYPSACIARCVGFREKEMEYGACSTQNPCDGVVCPINQICVPKKSVCLSITQETCKQHECVEKNSDCKLESVEPVCSSQNKEYENFCWLQKNNSVLAYRGRCQKNFCNGEKTVCGQNGETYNSECAALADAVKVDYEGPCMAVGIMAGHGNAGRCAKVKCSPLIPSNCLHVYPPGLCCPMCGGGLQVLFAKNQIDSTFSNVEELEQLTVHMVVESLQRHIQTAECNVFAFLGLYNVLVILVAPVYNEPTALQVKACVAETEKIALLIQHRNPVLLSDVILSHLVAAKPLPLYNSVAGLQPLPRVLFCFVLAFLAAILKSFLFVT